jgi:hypothetical protein
MDGGRKHDPVRPKPSIARFADEQIADPNEPNATFDPTRDHRGPPHGAGRVIVEKLLRRGCRFDREIRRRLANERTNSRHAGDGMAHEPTDGG